MADATWVTVLGLGLVLGLRHALDPDHIAAVSTIVGDSAALPERQGGAGWWKSIRRSSLVGTFWGLGHTAALLVAGVVVIALKFQISARLTLLMEFIVALMLILLGIKSLIKSAHGLKVHIHRHMHDGKNHVHVHMHRAGEKQTHRHPHLIRFRARSFLIGMVHGVAGSGTLMILVLATIPSAIAGVLYVAIFGMGSIGGMLLMSVIIGMPFVLTGKRFSLLGQALHVVVGLFSLSFGLFLAWQYGFREGLVF